MIREWNEESLDHRNALLYAMGISEEDAKRPVIGLVNSWNEMNPGHFPFDKTVIQEMKDEIYKAGGLALELPVSVTGSAPIHQETGILFLQEIWFPVKWRWLQN